MSEISVMIMGIRTWQSIKLLILHTSPSHQIQEETWTWGVEYIVDCADVLVFGSICHKQLGSLFYFTGTTEQGTSGAAGISETAELSKCEQQWCTGGRGLSRDQMFQIAVTETQANPHLMIPGVVLCFNCTK